MTYPFGQRRVDARTPRVSLCAAAIRAQRQDRAIGRQVPLDALLALTAVRRAFSGSYDLVHSHEEGGVIGVLLARWLRVPHFYDMHSSLPQQLSNFAFTGSTLVSQCLSGSRAPDDPVVSRGHRDLSSIDGHRPRHRSVGADRAHRERTRIGEGEPTRIKPRRSERSTACRRRRHWCCTRERSRHIRDSTSCSRAMAAVRRSRPDARLLLAGGKPAQVQQAKEQARAAGIDDVTIFTGERPASEIPAYLLASDVLVSPRSRGTTRR